MVFWMDWYVIRVMMDLDEVTEHVIEVKLHEYTHEVPLTREAHVLNERLQDYNKQGPDGPGSVNDLAVE